MLYYIILYCIVLYCSLSYYTVFYYIIYIYIYIYMSILYVITSRKTIPQYYMLLQVAKLEEHINNCESIHKLSLCLHLAARLCVGGFGFPEAQQTSSLYNWLTSL